MADIKFQTEWLSQIALLAQCGTAEDVVALCGAIERAAEGDFASELSPLVQLVFNPIANSMSEAQAKSERNRANGKRNEAKVERTISETERQGSDMGAKPSDIGAKPSKEKEEREENKEESREESEEVSPHTPLQEDKEESKGETREEREERETRACARESETALSIFADALPAPQFVPESDPHKLTDKGLEQEFEALWLLYPRKAGKADALRHYKAARKNGTSYDEVEQGIIRYTRHIEDEQTNPQYIAMGSTWFSGHRWEDVYARHGPKPGSFEWIAQL